MKNYSKHYQAKIKGLQEENASLKAEVERLTNCKAEADYLKAEVERLRLQVGTDAIDREHGMCCDSSAENARLKAEVERLTEDNRQLKKAFEIAEGIIKRMGNAAENAAKEGKPSV